MPALLALGAREADLDVWCDELESQLELMA